MRKMILALLLAASGVAAAGSSSNSSASSNAAGQLVIDYAQAYRALNLAGLELSFKTNIAALVRETDVRRQRALFTGFARRLKQVDLHSASVCERIDLEKMAFEIDTNLRKLDVVEHYRALGAKAAEPGTGLYTTALGQEWYAYLLRRWLTSDVTPDALMTMGRQQVEAALSRYRALQEKMGYAGQDAAFAVHLASDAYRYPTGETPQAEYEARQATVFANLDQLFPRAGIAPAVIAQSDRGTGFPADGYYLPSEHTFYFNNARGYYGRRDLDWLILHESTPGHHYQGSFGRQSTACPKAMPDVFYPAYVEGWGAYVEEYGSALGLYRQPSDELGAVEWDLVRSIRVVLDVGINHLGWTREQAFAYWHATLPMLPQLAEREITRVRDWPVQAITYKQGQYVLRQLRDAGKARDGERFDLRAFHESVLKYGPLPLSVLQAQALR